MVTKLIIPVNFFPWHFTEASQIKDKASRAPIDFNSLIAIEEVKQSEAYVAFYSIILPLKINNKQTDEPTKTNSYVVI